MSPDWLTRWGWVVVQALQLLSMALICHKSIRTDLRKEVAVVDQDPTPSLSLIGARSESKPLSLHSLPTAEN